MDAKKRSVRQRQELPSYANEFVQCPFGGAKTERPRHHAMNDASLFEPCPHSHELGLNPIYSHIGVFWFKVLRASLSNIPLASLRRRQSAIIEKCGEKPISKILFHYEDELLREKRG